MTSSLTRRSATTVLTLLVTAAGLTAGHGTAAGQHRPAGAVYPPHGHPAVAVNDQAPGTPAPAEGPRSCPDGMVLVEGEYCTNVDQRCLRWLDPEEQMRCGEFAPPHCSGRRRHVSVCMDRYEYPNQAGAHPQVMVSWYEAQRSCQSEGRRLCTQSEWTFACEGPDMHPYPYGNGLSRDEDACRIDHQTIRPDRARLGNPATTADESARLYEAVPSGSMPACVSWSGVHDLTGNVDEWTVNETHHPYNSALKGGWWGPIRARCRPSTISHYESFVYYQIGFRCCSDPTADSATPPSQPEDPGHPDHPEHPEHPEHPGSLATPADAASTTHPDA